MAFLTLICRKFALCTSPGLHQEATASVAGKGVFGRLKHESGTHRVQRVPVTEANGRVHTSTATVAILPQATEVRSPNCALQDR